MGKKLKVFILLSLVVIMSTGCMNKASGGKEKAVMKSEEKSKGEKIVIWHQYEPKIEEALNKEFKQFTMDNPNIEIELVKQNELANKVTLTGQSQKDAPDIICGPNDWTGRFATMGIIEPITSYIDLSILDEHLDTTKDAVMYKDNIYGIPLTYECLAFMYNKELLDTVPVNTDELLQMMKDKTKDEQWGFVHNVTDAYHVMAWIYGNGGYAIDEAGKPGLNTPGTIEALRLIGQMKPYLPKNVDYAVMDGLFKEGKAAAIINGSWAVGEYKENLGDNFGVATIPQISKTGNPGQPFLGVQAAFVSKTADKTEGMAKVIGYFASEKIGNLFADNGYLVSNKKVVLGDDIILNALQEQAQVATPMPTTPEMSQCWEPLSNALQVVVLEQDPDYKAIADEAQKDAEDRIKSIK